MPRGLVGLLSLPQPDRMTIDLPEGYTCLVSDDGTEMTSRVVNALRGRGWRVAVASFPHEIVSSQAVLPQGVQRVMIEEMSEEGLQRALAGVGPVAVFIHLNPLESCVPAGVNLYSDADRAILKQIFLAAKYLKQPLQDAARQGHAAFMTVSRLDGEFGLTQDSQFLPASGGLFGLVKTLSLEWSGVFCRALDLSPQMSAEEAAQTILSELHDPNRVIVEVGYGPHGRKTLVVEHPN